MVSAKVEYATLAILELAARADQGHPVPLRDIACSQQIPGQFLVQLLQRLKVAGLVRSTRGAAGGYLLARPADKISVWDVWAAVAVEESAEPPEPTDVRRAVLQAVWSEMYARRRESLEGTSIASLLLRCQDNTDPMYYI